MLRAFTGALALIIAAQLAAGCTRTAGPSSDRSSTTPLPTDTNLSPVHVLTGKVYFLQGHGEHDPTDVSTQGYSSVAEMLRTQGAEVSTLTLTRDGVIPDDATMLAIGGPRIDYSAPEIAALRRFADAGGGVLFMLDGPDKADSPPLSNLVALARSWDVDLGNNVIIDTSNVGQIAGGSGATAVGLPATIAHPIVHSFEMVTFFPAARSTSPVPHGTRYSATVLFETSEKTWAETDLQSLFGASRAVLDADVDKIGPVPLVVAVSANLSDPSTFRAVIIGDSDCLTNAMMPAAGNRELGLSIVQWLTERQP